MTSNTVLDLFSHFFFFPVSIFVTFKRFYTVFILLIDFKVDSDYELVLTINSRHHVCDYHKFLSERWEEFQRCMGYGWMREEKKNRIANVVHNKDIKKNLFLSDVTFIANENSKQWTGKLKMAIWPKSQNVRHNIFYFHWSHRYWFVLFFLLIEIRCTLILCEIFFYRNINQSEYIYNENYGIFF